MADLTPAKALIFRITHIANVPWILANGLHCRNGTAHDPHYVEIGNPDLIEKRRRRIVPSAPGGTLSDYIPFYFTPFSPMLYNIKTGWNGIPQRPMSEIVILATALPVLQERKISFVFSDRHAYLVNAVFSSDLADLKALAWDLWAAKDFARDPSKPTKFERYNAEALVYRHLPVEALHGIICHGETEEAQLKEMVHNSQRKLAVHSRPGWYF